MYAYDAYLTDKSVNVRRGGWQGKERGRNERGEEEKEKGKNRKCHKQNRAISKLSSNCHLSCSRSELEEKEMNCFFSKAYEWIMLLSVLFST